MLERIDELIEQLDDAGVSDQAVQLLQEIIQIADSQNIMEARVDARIELMYILRNLLRSSELATTFVQTLALCDEYPESFSPHFIADTYGWTISLLSNFHDVSLQRRDEMLQDYRERLSGMPELLWVVDRSKWTIAEDYGDLEMSVVARDALLRSEIFDLADEVDNEISHWLLLGNEKRAIEAGADLLSGKTKSLLGIRCLLMPLLRTGQQEEAAKQFRRIPAMNPDVFYWPYGNTLRYMALAMPVNHAQTISDCGACRRTILRHSDPLTQLYFYSDMIFVLSAYDRRGAVETTLGGPIGWKPESDSNSIAIPKLLAAYQDAAQLLADAFDARNQNTFASDRLARSFNG